MAAVVDHVTELFRTLRAPLAEGATALDELRHAFVTQAHRRRVEPPQEAAYERLVALLRPK